MHPQNMTPTDASPPIGFGLVDVSGGDVTFDRAVRGISFGVDGTIFVDTYSNLNVPIPEGYLAPKIQHACRITKIYQQGTTAQNIMVWY